MPRKSSELPGRRLHPDRFRVADEAKSPAQNAVALIYEGRKGRSAGSLSTLGWNLSLATATRASLPARLWTEGNWWSGRNFFRLDTWGSTSTDWRPSSLRAEDLLFCPCPGRRLVRPLDGHGTAPPSRSSKWSNTGMECRFLAPSGKRRRGSRLETVRPDSPTAAFRRACRSWVCLRPHRRSQRSTSGTFGTGRPPSRERCVREAEINSVQADEAYFRMIPRGQTARYDREGHLGSAAGAVLGGGEM